MPPSVQRSNAKHYKSNTIAPRSKSMRAGRTFSPPRRAGRRVADYALEWALDHAKSTTAEAAPTGAEQTTS